MRISSGGWLLAMLTACTQAPDGPASTARTDCSRGTATMAPDCIVERDGETLTVRFPDGGFRKVVIDRTSLLSAADGADAATLAIDPHGRQIVTIAADRFVVPAR